MAQGETKVEGEKVSGSSHVIPKWLLLIFFFPLPLLWKCFSGSLLSQVVKQEGVPLVGKSLPVKGGGRVIRPKEVLKDLEDGHQNKRGCSGLPLEGVWSR